MKKTEIVIIVLVLLSFAAGIYFYPQMPERIASHWDMQGNANGYLPRFWGVFLMPFILVIIAAVFLAIPRIDPLKSNIQKFRNKYDNFAIVFLLFMCMVYAQIILWNLGIQIKPNAVYPVGIGILLYFAGVLCEKSRRNWFIGIRTPWTLSSDKVWEKTNRLGGKLFKLSGAISIIGTLFPDYAFYFILIPIFSAAIISVVFSYLVYKK